MINLSIKEMIKSGIHLGHYTKFWNPKMKPFIYTKYNKIHIINLEQTIFYFKKALHEIKQIFDNKNKILFVSTKKNICKIVKKIAIKCNQYYINNRWLGGMLTNWQTVKNSIQHLKKLEKNFKNKTFNKLIKKEYLNKKKLLKKLNNNLGGIKKMHQLPDALFIIDAKNENLAVKEAKQLNIKTFAIIDTNNNPDNINYIIPGNDDSQKAIKWYLNKIYKIYKISNK